MAYKKIGFDAGLMSLRGTHIAIFDYALQNQKLLGNESVVFYDRRSEQIQPSVFEKFQKEFKLIPYDHFSELNPVADSGLIDAMYLIKSGERDQYLLPGVPNLIHAVFPQKVDEMHGDIYAYVSKWLSEECSNGKIPFVPHIIDLPAQGSSQRAALGISEDAVVFGCYGGSDSFNLDFVKKVIAEVVAKNAQIYFLFMNIDRFMDHSQVIFLPGNSDPVFKSSFINTCDAMIHARGIGESFGLACGEFSMHNKPVITYALSPQRNHIDVLGSKAILYKGPKDLGGIFLNFDKAASQKQNWDCYSQDFSPSAVMKKFQSVFLSDDAMKRAEINISSIDKAAVQGKCFRKRLRSLSRKLYL
uniref:Glycosyl transferase family 1 domain-containing protein n=1 Tax=Polynucleobacter necessarius subsp. necessarius (strain STIR1) TaxID=452638 RepID=B1XSX6_POLNS